MTEDLKKMYRTVMDDHFPSQITITFGDHVLVYRKRAWKLADQKTGELIEKGLRYGENPGQEAALYELVNGNLLLGDCKFIEPGNGLVSCAGGVAGQRRACAHRDESLSHRWADGSG